MVIKVKMAVRTLDEIQGLTRFGVESEEQRDEFYKDRHKAEATVQSRLLSRYAELKHAAIYGALPKDHELSRVVNRIYLSMPQEKGSEKIEVILSPEDYTVNACAAGNKIFITRGFLSLFKSEEELRFVLGHEQQHIINQDINQILAEERNVFGLLRLAEYRADLKSFAGKKGNTYGGILVMRKLQEHSQGSWDVAHGRSVDRLLNMLWVTRLIDLGEIEEITTPLPEVLIGFGKHKKTSKTTLELLLSKDMKEVSGRLYAANNASLHQALAPLQELFKRYDTKSKFAAKLSSSQSSAKLLSEDDRHVFNLLTRRIESILQDVGYDKQDSAMLTGVISSLTGNIDPRKVYNTKGINIIKRMFANITSKDSLYRLLNLVDADKFYDLGVACLSNKNLLSLINIIALHSCENGFFTAKGKFDVKAYASFAFDAAKKFQGIASGNGKLLSGIINEFYSVGMDEFDDGSKEQAKYTQEFNRLNAKPGISLKSQKKISQEIIDYLDDNSFEAKYGEISKELHKIRQERILSLIHEQYSDKITFLEILCTYLALNPFQSELDEEDKRYNHNTYVKSFQLNMASLRNSGLQNIIDAFAEGSGIMREIEVIRYSRVIYSAEASKTFTLPEYVLTFQKDTLDEKYLEDRDIDDLIKDGHDLVDILKSYKDAATGTESLKKDFPFITNVELTVLGQEHTNFEFIRSMFLRYEMSRCKNKSEISSIILNYLEIEHGIKGNEHHSNYLDLLEDVFGRFDFDVGNLDDAKTLYYLSFMLPTESYRAALQDIALKTIFQQSFEDGFDFIFSGLSQHHLRSTVPLEELIEKKATRHEHFEKLKEKVDDLLGYQAVVEGLEKVQGLEFISNLVNPRFRLRFFKAALATPITDKYLKALFYELTSGYVMDDIEKMYRLGLKYKYALLRNLLCSENGLLMTEKSRNTLAKTLIKEVLEEPDQEDDKRWYDEIYTLAKNFVVDGDLETVYFALVPLIIDRMLTPPNEPYPMRNIVIDSLIESKLCDYDSDFREYAQDILLGKTTIEDVEDELIEELNDDEDYDEYDFSEAKEKLIALKDSLKDSIATIAGEAERILKSIEGNTEERYIDDYHSLRDERRVNAKLDVIIKSHTKKQAYNRLKPLEFIVETAKHIGAPGVRFLQLLGQYLDIPQSYAGEFSKVYDNVRGQSKLSAYMLLEREMPAFKQTIAEIGDCVGGGSLMTVYRVKTSAGTEEVIKVLNPNAMFHTNQAFRTIRSIIESMVSTDEKYELGLPLLDDIKEWIEKDINFERFLERDREFYSANNGFSLGSGYRVKVPKSLGQDNKHYKREEYIDGINLTNIEELRRQGHDIKAIVALVANNYLTQIQRGQVHSDVHPGNFRITKEREVAILDRNFYLELDTPDQMLLATLVQDSVDMSEKTNTLLEYLGVGKDHLKYTSLKSMIQKEMESGRPLFEQLGDVIKHIKQENVAFPLKMTLLVKNFYALDSLARDAGFNSLNDAFSYKAA